MSLFEILILFVIMLPLAAMPSSSVALVVARSASAGRISGVVSALGIVAGDLIFVAIALLGMSFLAEWLGAFFTLVKYCGGAYLIWLGFCLFKSKSSQSIPLTRNRASSLVLDFTAGLFLTLGDVKAILFYASLFPALVDMKNLNLWDMMLIMLTTAVTVGGVKLVYVLFASTLVEKLRGRVSSDMPRKFGGAVMMGCGALLLASDGSA